MFKFKQKKVDNQRLQNAVKNSLIFCSFFLGFSLLANGQINFDYTYPENGGATTIKAKGKSVVTKKFCDEIIMVNSVMNINGYYDFQVSFIHPQTGTTLRSYTYGDPYGDDFCNSICKSYNNYGYILAGESANNNMLVMEIEPYGDLVWSKEVNYGNKIND